MAKTIRLKFAPELERALRAGTKYITLRVDMPPVAEVGDELVGVNAETGEEIVRGQIVEVWAGPLLALPVKWYHAEGVGSYLELKQLLARFYGTVRDDALVVAIRWAPRVAGRSAEEEKPVLGYRIAGGGRSYVLCIECATDTVQLARMRRGETLSVITRGETDGSYLCDACGQALSVAVADDTARSGAFCLDPNAPAGASEGDIG